MINEEKGPASYLLHQQASVPNYPFRYLHMKDSTKLKNVVRNSCVSRGAFTQLHIIKGERRRLSFGHQSSCQDLKVETFSPPKTLHVVLTFGSERP